MRKEYKYISNFDSRNDLQRYDNNALLLYALELRYDIEDIHSLASESITDGSDDKKMDMIFIDEDNGRVVVAQSYIAEDTSKIEAKENKASDLNTAASWLLSMDENELPDRVKTHVLEVRRLIKGKNIEEIIFWYCHNLPESENVEKALISVKNTATSYLKHYYPDSTIEVYSVEVGVNQIEEYYLSRSVTILVNDIFNFDYKHGYEIKANNWSAYSTYIDASFLYQLYKKYSTKLFSANIRDYLGSRKADKNINNGIKESSIKEPDNFWAYNNGITAIVNNYRTKNKKLIINGISIVNGAQTSGAIGNEEKAPENVKIPIRFIKCNNHSIIRNIIRYNNSQNRIEPSDFRSNDKIQEKISSDLLEKYGIEYGFRRGGKDDSIRRPKSNISSNVVAQSLFGLKKKPRIAYHEKNKIWEDDGYYNTIFNETTNCENILFAYSLLKSIEHIKRNLKEKSNNDELKTTEEKQLEYLRQRGASFLLMSAISSSLELILDKKISDYFNLQFIDSITDIDNMINEWKPIITSLISYSTKLSEALNDGLRSDDQIKKSTGEFVSMVDATKDVLKETFLSFATKIK